MRQLSCSLTTPQVRAGDKTASRRLGWKRAQAGDLLMLVEKAQGIPKGEHVKAIRPVELISVRREPLDMMTTRLDYGAEEVIREGFPNLTPAQFVEMFCEHMGCEPSTEITRLEWKYIGCPKCKGEGLPIVHPEKAIAGSGILFCLSCSSEWVATDAEWRQAERDDARADRRAARQERAADRKAKAEAERNALAEHNARWSA